MSLSECKTVLERPARDAQVSNLIVTSNFKAGNTQSCSTTGIVGTFGELKTTVLSPQILITSDTIIPGTYSNADITVNEYGIVTLASDGDSGAGSITQVDTGPGLQGGPITTTGTIELTDTGVVPGSYSNAAITIDAQGRVGSASDNFQFQFVYPHPRTHAYFFDDFVFGTSSTFNNSLVNGDTNWQQYLLSGGSTFPLTNASAFENGFIELKTSSWSIWGKSSLTVAVGGGNITMMFKVNLRLPPTNPNDSIFIGLAAATTQPGTINLGNDNPLLVTQPCILARAQHALSNPNWELLTGNGSGTVNETTVTNVPWVENTWTRLTISINADGNSVSLYVNDILSQTNTSNIPITTLFPMFGVVDETVGFEKAFRIDYFSFLKTLSVPR